MARNPGRPRLSQAGRTVTMSFSLKPQQAAWIRAKGINQSELMRFLVEQKMKEERATHDE